MKRLQGKTAIVTGGASGIGAGIAECFAQEGARVAIIDANLDGARLVVEGCEDLKKNDSFAIEADVTSDEQVLKQVGIALTMLRHIDILVNNAGTAGEIGDPLSKNTVENWKKVYDTNTLSGLRTVMALESHFKERKSGCIINVASIVAHNRGEMQMKPAYNASKSAIVAFTRWLAIQMAPYNVRANSISPGLLYTGFWRKLGNQLRKERPEQYPPDVETYDVFKQRVQELVPLGREQTPHDVGWAAVFLASDDAMNITGIDIPVDGGVLAR